jgi:DNA-binding FadR family transcriptional regulator
MSIVERGLSAGASLGSEMVLSSALGTSKWTVREALHILEREGIVAVRRGRYGGIFVMAPSVDAISMSIRSYLEFMRVDINEIVSARRVLDEAILSLAVTFNDIASLRAAQDLDSDIEGIHAGFVQYEALLTVARSPILQTFVRAVGKLGLSAILRSRLSDQELANVMRCVRIKRREQIEAVIAGRTRLVMSIENEVLNATSQLLQSANGAPATDSAALRLRALHLLKNARRFKRPELLMQEITADVVVRGWPVGEHLGTEAELLRRYSVGRSAFREAVRSLEQIGVVEMRSGRHSGLKIGSPHPRTVISNAQRQFSRMAIGQASYQEAFAALGCSAASLAAERTKSAGPGLPDLVTSPDSEYLATLADASGNRIIAMLLRILTINSSRVLGPAVSREFSPEFLR